jgi:hypothetical protein
MKMNQRIVKTTCPPDNPSLLGSRCSGAFFAPHQAGGVASSNDCCRACDRLFFNGRWIQCQTDESKDHKSACSEFCRRRFVSTGEESGT